MSEPASSGAAAAAPDSSSGRERHKAFQPPADREVFVVPLTVAPEDIDENRHVNNVVYVRWLQDVGTAHWNARFDEATRAKWSWVCLRHEVDYRRELKPGEIARGRTWVAEAAQGPRFDRFIRLDHPDGQMCAQVHTTWVLIEQATGRPRRVPDWITGMFA